MNTRVADSAWKKYVRRTLNSPRWQFLRPWLAPYVLSGGADEQWLRVVLNRETERLISALHPDTVSALEISGTHWNRPGLFREYRTVNYPDYDVCADTLPDRFELIIAEQVFEHLLWPYRAGRNVYTMLNQGGHFLISTPFLIPIHEHPYDCSRWTETGLKCLLTECGFDPEKVKSGSWGNRACVVGNFSRWQIYQRWRHSLVNDPKFPVMVWALAQK